MNREWLMFILGAVLGSGLTFAFIAIHELNCIHNRLENLIKKMRGE